MVRYFFRPLDASRPGARGWKLWLVIIIIPIWAFRVLSDLATKWQNQTPEHTILVCITCKTLKLWNFETFEKTFREPENLISPHSILTTIVSKGTGGVATETWINLSQNSFIVYLKTRDKCNQEMSEGFCFPRSQNLKISNLMGSFFAGGDPKNVFFFRPPPEKILP